MGLLSSLGDLVGGIGGQLASADDRNKSEELARQAYEEAINLGLPPDESKRLVLEKFKSAGKLTPELEQAINLGPSKVEGIQEDQSLIDAQRSALRQMQQQSQTGLNATDRASFNKLRGETQRDVEAKRQQILMNAQQRGMGGSGQELASQMLAAQAGADRASAQGDEISSQASQRALQALSQAGALSGQVRGQDFDVSRTKASAADEFNRFNTQNAIARQQRNVGSNNAAQQFNLTNDQRLSDNNVGMGNQETRRQSDARTANWRNLIDRIQVRQGAYKGQSKAYGDQAAATNDRWRGLAQSVGNTLEEGAKAYASGGASEGFSTGHGAGMSETERLGYNNAEDAYNASQKSKKWGF